jgi:hypothetical protein
VPPRSAYSLAASWTGAQDALPDDRWLAIRSEYGETAYWIALALAPEEFEDIEVVGNDAEGPEAALDRLAVAISARELPAATVPGVPTPQRSVGGAVLADAIAAVAGALPRGWWLQGFEGVEGRGSPPGWLAFANGGPDNDYEGEQGWGSTLEDALADLVTVLRR